LILAQVLFHEGKTRRDNRRVVEKAQERERVGNHVKRIEDVKQRKRRGTECPHRHRSVAAASRIAHKTQQESTVPKKALQGSTRPKPLFNSLSALDDGVEVNLRDALCPALYVALVNFRQSIYKSFLLSTTKATPQGPGPPSNLVPQSVETRETPSHPVPKTRRVSIHRGCAI